VQSPSKWFPGWRKRFRSPSFAAAEANAVQAIWWRYQLDTSTPSYQARSTFRLPKCCHGFNSWLRQADPGSVFSAPFASELKSHDLRTQSRRAESISISQMSFRRSTDAPYNVEFQLWCWRIQLRQGIRVFSKDQTECWTSDDTFVTGGSNDKLVDGLVGRGSVIRLPRIALDVVLQTSRRRSTMSHHYPGFDFTFTEHTIGLDTGSGVRLITVPNPEPTRCCSPDLA
jgi:hypothetical protein